MHQASKVPHRLHAITASGKSVPARIFVGTIATSDHFPNDHFDSQRLSQYHIPLVAMETASMMKTCWLFKTPCIAFRSVSDLLEPTHISKYNSWNKMTAIIAANNAALFTVAFIHRIAHSAHPSL